MELHYESNSLQHHGIKGMRWGVRRYQNKDGSLTPLGEKRAAGKSLADKKAIENLKDQRAARYISLKKARQELRESARDKRFERRLAKERSRIEAEKAKVDAETARQRNKQAAEDMKNDRADRAAKRALDKQGMRNLTKDRAADRDITNRKMKLEESAAKNRDKDVGGEEYYELPDTPAKQSTSSGTGKKLAVGALAAVGTVAAVAAIKKYGPSIAEKIRNMKTARKRDNDVNDIYVDDFADLTKDNRSNSPGFNVSNALSSIGNVPLLAAPKK